MTEKEELLELMNEKVQKLQTIKDELAELESEYAKKYSPFQQGDLAKLYNRKFNKFSCYVRIDIIKRSGTSFVYNVQPMKKNNLREPQEISFLDEAGLENDEGCDINTILKVIPLKTEPND